MKTVIGFLGVVMMGIGAFATIGLVFMLAASAFGLKVTWVAATLAAVCLRLAGGLLFNSVRMPTKGTR